MVKKILVPTDGSEPSDNALECAAELAKLYKYELVVLNVVNTSAFITYRRVSIKGKLEEELEEKARRLVGRSVNTVEKLGVKAEGIIRHGLPDKEIIALAKERDDIELVVMGAYGKNFIERKLVGSNTERVLRRITELAVPLIIVSHPCKRVSGKGDKIPRRILVATDGSVPSNTSVECAAELGELYKYELVVLNVVGTGIATAYHGVSIKGKLEEELEEKARRLVGRSVNTVEKLGVKAEGIIRHGLPDKEIIALAKERDDIELVVMGAYGKNFIERKLVGSNTERVLRRLPELDMPLVIVPCPKCVE